MKRIHLVLVAAATCAVIIMIMSAQRSFAQAAGQPFKFGTFQYQGRSFGALVLRDVYVVDIAAAAKADKQTVPSDLLTIIEQWDSVGDRFKTIARIETGRLDGKRPAYVYDLKSVKTLIPFQPPVFLNAAGNFLEHRGEMASRAGGGAAAGGGGGAAEGGGGGEGGGGEGGGLGLGAGRKPGPDPSIPGTWERSPDDKRQNPFLFLSPHGVEIAEGEAIQIPLRRTKVDYECELLAIMGKPTRRVTPSEAKKNIWGYSVILDVSDRGGRERDSRGSDWFLQKGQDTFKPFGPFIVPAEFVDALNTPMHYTLNGKEMMRDNTENTIHNMYELIQYASNILTLKVGDVMALGTPPGVGVARKPPVFLHPGDVSACTYEGVGTLTNPIIAEESRK
jgi:2-keto-4-pentenoate hydratase/2-oxohepta-3-ene-1,7-dioic acid hydratase in catechol pathway